MSSRKSKRSKGDKLAAALSEVTGGADDFDPEELVSSEGEAWSDDGWDPTTELGTHGHEVESESRLRLRPDIALDDGSYAGELSSRKLRDDAEDWEKTGAQPSLHPDFDDDFFNDERHFDEGPGDGGQHEDLQSFVDALEEEDIDIVKSVAKSQNREQEQAKNVAHQTSLIHDMVECRIRVQRALAAVNRLPQSQEFAAVADTQPSVAEALTRATAAAAAYTAQLRELQGAVQSSNDLFLEPAEGDGESAGKRKRKRTDSFDSNTLAGQWEEASQTFTTTTDVALACLDSAHQTVQLGTGLAAKKLMSLNQGISSQVDRALADEGRLIKRARTYRNGSEPLLTTSTTTTAGAEEGNNEEDGPGTDVYDDSDFYHSLLKDLIDSASASTGNAQQMGQQWVALQKLKGKKMKKHRDRKASKGRKLRYDVHPDIVNFMAPAQPPMEDFPVSELFDGLFGNH